MSSEEKKPKATESGEKSIKVQSGGKVKSTKRNLKLIGIIFGVFILFAILNPSDDKNKQDDTQANSSQSTEKEAKPPVGEKKTPRDQMFAKILKLVDSKKAFDTGSYVKGDVPQGEYAFVSFEGSGKYYSEEDSAGNIIDNENFDSFGYVYVHDVGNVTTQGVLVATNAFKALGVTGAKDIYEKLNDTKNYKGSAWYKVGTDIAAGQYVIQSLGESYVAVMSGPVGNNEIVDNNNFNGKYSVNVQNGQYLQVSRGEIFQ